MFINILCWFFLVLIGLGTIVLFLQFYNHCFYYFGILMSEPRDFNWFLLLLLVVNFVILFLLSPSKSLVSWIFFITSIIYWFSFLPSYFKHTKNNFYPFNPDFFVYFIISTLLHTMLVVAVILL